jgi:phosphoribosylglycinamide formyltransferase-1
MKLKVALMGSGQGKVGEGLIAAAQASKCCFEIVACIADRPCRFAELFQPTEVHPYKNFTKREAYDTHISERLKTYNPDLVFLVGYMRLITTPLLQAFPNRILNVHPADLTVGDRNYAGLGAVQKALEAGEAYTRSTVITVSEGIDDGAIVTLGPKVPYKGQRPVTKESCATHQERQKTVSCIPACIAALEKQRRELCVEL